MENQTNYTIAEEFYLPSGGKIYEKAVDPQIRLRSMTGRDEMKRTAPSTSQFKMLADLIEGCMIEKPAISVYDMALGDYEFLLHKLRVVTYGDEYKMALQCPSCGNYVDAVAHLDELEVKEFDLDTFNNLRNIKLPKSGDTILLKFQTPRNLDQADQKIKEYKRKFKDANIDFNQLVSISTAIEEVNGSVSDLTRLETYINNLPAADLIKISNSIDTLNSYLGIDTRLIVPCPKCGSDIKTFFRFGPEFFRPTSI